MRPTATSLTLNSPALCRTGVQERCTYDRCAALTAPACLERTPEMLALRADVNSRLEHCVEGTPGGVVPTGKYCRVLVVILGLYRSCVPTGHRPIVHTCATPIRSPATKRTPHKPLRHRGAPDLGRFSGCQCRYTAVTSFRDRASPLSRLKSTSGVRLYSAQATH